MAKVSVRDLDLAGKRVFSRADLNVPLSPDVEISGEINGEITPAGGITDATRIRAFLPTLELVRKAGARVVVASHLGRPKGKPNPKMSLRPVAERLEELLGGRGKFVSDCVGRDVEQAAAELQNGDVLLLENLRFHPEEEKNDAGFGRKLAALSEVYINDAFGAAHRAHASTEAITRFAPVSAAGLLMERELDYLRQATENPAQPYVAIVGGAKVSDKIELLENLIRLTQTVLVGGAMAYTFLKSRGVKVGSSRVEEDKLEQALGILTSAEKAGVHVKLPQDHVAADRLEAGAEARVIPSAEIPDGLMGLDIGPATRKDFAQEISQARTIVWNGPMGVFEMESFAAGTLAVAHAVADSPAVSIVGGGDSVAAVVKAGVQAKISHISTGGGASLEFLSGLKLPGVEALSEK